MSSDSAVVDCFCFFHMPDIPRSPPRHRWNKLGFPFCRLKGQLTSILYEVASDGTIEVETKKKQKQRGLLSPDRADALVMAVWARSIPGQARQESKPLRGVKSTRDRAGIILGV